MEELKDWSKTIVVVGAIGAVLYAAWLLAIIVAVIAFSYVMKAFISAGRD